MVVLATLLVLAGAGGFYWHFSRSLLKIRMEASNSRRVAEQIAAEGRRRILGLDPRPYPTRANPRPLLPASMLVGGLALLTFAIWPLATHPLAVDDEQSEIPTAGTATAREDQELDAHTTTVGANLFVRDQPYLSGLVKDRLPPGSPIRVECWAQGDAVINNGTEYHYWLRISLPTEGWVSGAYVELHNEEFKCDS